MGIKQAMQNEQKGSPVVAPTVTAEVPTSPVAPATAEVPTQKPPVSAGDKKQKSAAFDEFKSQGVMAREQYTDEQKAVECSKSETIQFVIALGHPGKPQKRVQNGKSLESHQVVGYVFKALEDVSVPVAKPIEGSKSLMDCELVGEKQVKAGETFMLTLFETGCFISRIEYGGHFTGGGDEVILHATISATHDGRPLTVLKRPSAPIKDKMELIADKIPGADGKNTYKCKPEYEEKFGYLFTRKKATRTLGAKKSDEGSYKALAAAFRQFQKGTGAGTARR